MMRCLRMVNVDNNTVGWYQSSVAGNFLTQEFVDSQYAQQREVASSVVLVCDPVRTIQGKLALKAYRLTREFMRTYSPKRPFLG